MIVIVLGLTADFTGSDSIELITPLPLMFSIWLPIYAGVFGFAVLQLRMRWREHYHVYGVRSWFLTSLFLAGTWSYLFKLNIAGLPWLQIIVALATLITAYVALKHLFVYRKDAIYLWFVSLPVGLYAGWITLATTLIVSEALNIPGSNVNYAAFILSCAVLVILITLHRVQDIRGYTLAILWGLTGILLVHTSSLSVITLVSAIGIIAIAFSAYRKLR